MKNAITSPLFLTTFLIIIASCTTNTDNTNEKTAIIPPIQENVKAIEVIEPPVSLNNTKSIIIYEDSINGIQLPFKKKDIMSELKSTFKGFEIKKKIAQQDGPDFHLFSVMKDGKKTLNFEMDYEDTLKLDLMTAYDNSIEDIYGIKIGDSYAQIKKKRKGNIHSSTESYEMRNTYVYFDNSNIIYGMTGKTYIPDEDPDFQLSEEQIKDWTVKSMIWRKQINVVEESIKDYFIPDSPNNKANFHTPARDGGSTDMTRTIFYINKGTTYDIMDSHMFNGQASAIQTMTVQFSANEMKMTKSVSTTILETNKKKGYNPARIIFKIPPTGQTISWTYTDIPGDNIKCTASWIMFRLDGELKKGIQVIKQYEEMTSNTIEYYVKGIGLVETRFQDANGSTMRPSEKFDGLNYDTTAK